MNENKYTIAGWLAIANAVIFPLAFVVGIIQTAIGMEAFRRPAPAIFGPSDILFIAFTIIAVFILLRFRDLLNEYYNYRGLNTIIMIAIAWSILFQFISLALKFAVVPALIDHERLLVIVQISFMVVGMVTMGVIDLIFGIKLLKAAEDMHGLMKAYAIVCIISGCLEVAVILSPLALLLVPVSFIMLGMIFLKEKEQVEFV
jgi:hypothetical protein